jgi:gliding motility-associated lipoprotein GldD
MLSRFLIVCIVFNMVFIACINENYLPKPNGYLRIDFPEKKYIRFDKNLPYSFEYPVYGIVKLDSDRNAEPFWINIEFPKYKGKIHLSYKRINKNLPKYIEDSRKLAYKHTLKADAIDELRLIIDSSRVYGILYDIKGNTASSVQFFVTDSNKNFLRGALYFSVSPNKDSLAPVIDFFKTDIIQLINTLKWN